MAGMENLRRSLPIGSVPRRLAASWTCGDVSFETCGGINHSII